MTRPGPNVAQECPFCDCGRIEIPHWMEDVESWEKVTAKCPVCEGKWFLTADEWDQREIVLGKKRIPGEDR